MRAVVVEDSVEIALLMTVVLERAGVIVTAITSGFETLYKDLDWSDVDVILTDQALDDYDGKRLLRWLSQAHPSIRRIMITGSSLTTPEEASADLVLIKPVSAAAILSSLEGLHV